MIDHVSRRRWEVLVVVKYRIDKGDCIDGGFVNALSSVEWLFFSGQETALSPKEYKQQSTFELGPREWREWSLFRGFNEQTWEVSFFILLRCACLRINHHLTQSFLWNFSNNLIFDCSIAAAKQQLSAATGKQLINQSIGACASVDCGECSTLCLPNEFLLTNNLHDS